jgi:outer membrane protein OmpA-like peptidoglycan-associated protein
MTKIAHTLKSIVSGAPKFALLAIVFGAMTAGCVPASTVVDNRSHETVAPAVGTAAPVAPAQVAVVSPAPAVAPPLALAAAVPAVPPPLPPLLPFNEAITTAARNLFRAALAQDPNAKFVVIDPLVDGMSGYQSKATQSIQDIIIRVAKQDFPQYVVKSITPESLGQQPRILVGTFTPVNAQMKTTGEREAYRFCLVMGDLKTGKVVAKSVVRVPIAEADSTPTLVFGDSPVWSDDPSVQAYIATCQSTKVGDSIKPEYIDGLLAASLINEAVDAYNSGLYADALELYTTARKTPQGDQLRVYDGIYLSLMKLGRTQQSQAAFKDLVDFGLRRKRLATLIEFRPGSVRFETSTKFPAGTYDMWLQQIASESAAQKACLQITGHTSPTGPAALNDSLSLLRAEFVQTKLERDAPALQKRTIAGGVGSRENIIGTGKDNSSDAIDRRVELKPIEPCT